MDKSNQRIQARFETLVKEGLGILATHQNRSGFSSVNTERAYAWGASCLNLLVRVFGDKNPVYIRFQGQMEEYIAETSNFRRAFGTFKGAQDEFDHDVLFDTRKLIMADIFDDFLEQAEYLLSKGYYQPAAVLAGAVLEDSLRKLCDTYDIEIGAKPSLSIMNDALKKQEIYNKIQWREVSWMADIRNNAAHGQWEQLTSDDVEKLVKSVHMFLMNHLM